MLIEFKRVIKKNGLVFLILYLFIIVFVIIFTIQKLHLNKIIILEQWR